MTVADRAGLSGCLGRLPAAQLTGMFQSAAIMDQWQRDSPTLTLLELPEETGGVNPGDQRALLPYRAPATATDL